MACLSRGPGRFCESPGIETGLLKPMSFSFLLRFSGILHLESAVCSYLYLRHVEFNTRHSSERGACGLDRSRTVCSTRSIWCNMLSCTECAALAHTRALRGVDLRGLGLAGLDDHDDHDMGNTALAPDLQRCFVFVFFVFSLIGEVKISLIMMEAQKMVSRENGPNLGNWGRLSRGLETQGWHVRLCSSNTRLFSADSVSEDMWSLFTYWHVCWCVLWDLGWLLSQHSQSHGHSLHNCGLVTSPEKVIFFFGREISVQVVPTPAICLRGDPTKLDTYETNFASFLQETPFYRHPFASGESLKICNINMT